MKAATNRTDRINQIVAAITAQADNTISEHVLIMKVFADHVPASASRACMAAVNVAVNKGLIYWARVRCGGTYHSVLTTGKGPVFVSSQVSL